MTKEDFLEECESRLVFEDKNIHATINDQGICPFCGNPMKWIGFLYCGCKTQKEYFEKKKEIEAQISQLQKSLQNLNKSYTEKTFPFFKKYFLKQIDDAYQDLVNDKKFIETISD
jgi:hypothetical protein